jgi:hypothetical protein
MSSNHNEHHSNENKPISFTVPFILAVVTLVTILMLVSIGDPSHDKCECAENCSKECMEACEKGDHSKHPEKEGHEEGVKEEKAEPKVETSEAATAVDTVTKATEAHH